MSETHYSRSGASPPSSQRATLARKPRAGAPAVTVDPHQPLLKIREVASICRCSVSCVRAWRFAGKIPFVQLNGKNLLFRRDDLEAFIERSTVPAKRVAS
jgi:excisionase family DNA binding protein